MKGSEVAEFRRHRSQSQIPSSVFAGSMFRIFRNLIVLAVMLGGMYTALETESGRDAVSSVMSNFQGGTTLVSTDDDGYGNHAHHDVENIRRVQGDRFRYDAEIAERMGAVPTDPLAAPKLVGAHIDDLREVLRFDIDPSWVIGRFSRVSTVLAETQMEGLRVPIVTGTKPSDIAGTLTYYFDHANQLKRITIHGFTGDPKQLVTTMTEYYGMTPAPSLEAGVYTKSWNAIPIHFMRITHAPVVHSDAVHQKYTLFLELNDPNSPFGISQEAREIIISDRSSGRW